MLSPGEIEDPLITSDQLLSLKSDIKIIDMLEEISMKHCPQQFEAIENGGKINKSNEKALKLRQDGLRFFKQKNYLKSLFAYTECIANAENQTEILGLAYAGRSQVLFERGRFKECLEDIERALANNYPKELLETLEERKKQANELLKSKQITKQYHDPLPKVVNPNPKIACASNSIDIIKDEFNNRNIVATKNIEIGEVISVEKPYAVAVKDEQKFLHCHECLEFSYNLIPCTNCRTALYCSEQCKESAWKTYHYNECDLFQYDFTEQLSLKTVLKCIKEMMMMTMETVNRNGSLNNNNNNLCTNNNGIQFDGTIYRSNRYEEIQDLKTNKEKRTVRDIFEAANEACIYNYFLKKYSDFFTKTNNIITCERLKELLFHHYFNTSCNKITIEKIKKTTINTEFQEVGDGLYAFSSLLNHHCYGNVTSTFYGSVLVLQAAKEIQKGESCCLTYRNLNFAEYPKLLRTHQLWKYYYLDCKCNACEYNWPIFDCLNIGNTEQYQKLIEIVQKALNNSTTSSDLKNGNTNNDNNTEGEKITATKNNNDNLLEIVKKYAKELSPGEPTKVDVNIKRIFCDLLKLSGNKILNF